MLYPYEDVCTAANDAWGSGTNQEGCVFVQVRCDIHKLVFIEGFLLFSIDFGALLSLYFSVISRGVVWYRIFSTFGPTGALIVRFDESHHHYHCM